MSAAEKARAQACEVYALPALTVHDCHDMTLSVASRYLARVARLRDRVGFDLDRITATQDALHILGRQISPRFDDLESAYRILAGAEVYLTRLVREARTIKRYCQHKATRKERIK